MSDKARISEMKDAPFSWKERDLLTAAEKYMEGVIEFPLIEYALPCFPKLDNGITQKIAQVWRYMAAAFHLQKTFEEKENGSSNPIQHKAARIYELEAHRILGSIFSLENEFWKAFYIRQELEETKPLIALDALHFSTRYQEQIAYQLLLQSLKAILQGYYEPKTVKKIHFENAKRLITDLPMTPLRSWLNHQLQ